MGMIKHFADDYCAGDPHPIVWAPCENEWVATVEIEQILDIEESLNGDRVKFVCPICEDEHWSDVRMAPCGE